VQDIFRDKVVIITGSRQGIGKTLAQYFAGAGAKLVIVSRNSEGLEEVKNSLTARGCEVLSVAGDISDESTCSEIVNKTIAKFGKIDILINNAGISGKAGVEEGNTIVFRKQIEVNLLGSFYITRYALPHLKASKGNVIFVSSLAGIYGLPYHSGYSASKMALTALAQSLKAELHGLNVHVGIAYVGFTENDPKKEAFTATGELKPLEKRKVSTVSAEKTALLIVKQIRNRKFISVHSGIGKIQWVISKFFPQLIEIILRKNLSK
jgi:short-subunit dehydrogenase